MTSRDGKFYSQAVLGQTEGDMFLREVPAGQLPPDELATRVLKIVAADTPGHPRLQRFLPGYQ